MSLKQIIKSNLVEMARGQGYELTPEWKIANQPLVRHLKATFARYRIDCVLDVGGNMGQYHDLIRDDVGFTGHIVSFEPVAKYQAMIADKAKGDPAWRLCRYALGSAESTAEINVTRSPGLNSFLAPRADVVSDMWNADSIVATETVRIRALDDVIDELKGELGFSRPYLKLDTQGFDLEALRGAERTLPWVCAMQTEASVRAIYEGMPDWRESIAFAEARGFDLSGMFPVTVDDAMRLVEFDCVLVNRRMAEQAA